ncbi:MAG: hypothetical protein GX442_21015 [Candidatus Riflebacteria bacterium]|nr:hypothetical protein [Candidatus Riflebacteria bacterium]
MTSSEPGPAPSLPTFRQAWRFLTGEDRINAGEPAGFARQMGTLLQSNVPLGKGLELIRANAETPAFARVVTRVQAGVSAGLPLSRALAAERDAFPPGFGATVRAGELGGDPGRFLLHLAGRLEVWQQFTGRLTGVAALLTRRNFLYLVILGIIATALLETDLFVVGIALLVFVLVPTGGMFALFAAGGLAAQGLALAGRGLGSLLGPATSGNLAARLPVIGPLMRKRATARFCWTLGTLIQTGLPLVTAVEAAMDATDDAVVTQDLRRHLPALRAGKSLARLLKGDSRFPFYAVQMIAVGEETGDLGRLLLIVAETCDTEVDGFLDGLGNTVPFLLTAFFIFGTGAWLYYMLVTQQWYGP